MITYFVKINVYIYKMSLWNDPEIQKTMALMDPKTKYEYAKVGEYLYKEGGLIDIINDRIDPEATMLELGTQIKLLLRDGMSPDLLTIDEKKILLAVFGPEEMKDIVGDYFDVYQNEQINSNCISYDNGKDQRTKTNSKRTKRRRK